MGIMLSYLLSAVSTIYYRCNKENRSLINITCMAAGEMGRYENSSLL